jgi:hypothetical protein
VLALVVVIGVLAAVLNSGGGSSDQDVGGGKKTGQSATKDRNSGSEKKKSQAPSGPEGDVKITKCEVDSTTTWASAEVLITNRSSKASNYIVSVEFVDHTGKRLDEAFTATNNLAPGQTAESTAQGLHTISAKIKCKVVDVTRYAS